MRLEIFHNTNQEEVIAAAKCEQSCSKCMSGCSYGSGAFAQGEEKKLAEFLGVSEEELNKNYLEPIQKFDTVLMRPKLIREQDKPYGQCIFFHPKIGCTIHEVKPLQCKTATCKEHGEDTNLWFELNNFLDKNNPESIRQFIQYLRSGGKTLQGADFHELFDEEMLKQALSYEK